jgi:DNA-directed RNA polymerase subunit beta
MSTQILSSLRVRKDFAKIKKVLDIPFLLELQKASYDRLLQFNVPEDKKDEFGLQKVFKSVFPIKHFNDISTLEYRGYKLEDPKYNVEECRERGLTFAAPLRVSVALHTWDVDEITGEKSLRDIKEQEVYFGEIPLMTDNGTFIINGTERVVVSQLHRSPGAFFEHDKGKGHPSGKKIYSARVIPYRGSWLDFEFDHKDLLYVRIDRRRKMYATLLLKALGYSTQELLQLFYDTEVIRLGEDGALHKVVNYELLQNQTATQDILMPDTGEVIVKKNRKITKSALKKMHKADIQEIPIALDNLEGKYFAYDIVDEDTGLVIFEANEEVLGSGNTDEKIQKIRAMGRSEIEILFIDKLNVGSYLRDTLALDGVNTPEEAVKEIYKRMRPGEPPTTKQAMNYFRNLFFVKSRYDLSPVGRLKLNHKFGLMEPLLQTTLTPRDIVEIVKYLIKLRDQEGKDYKVDDIDHLGNRRVRAVGELVENQFRIGLVRMERSIKEKMTMAQDRETLMPHELINAKPVSAVIKEYFGSGQLSQFMDQTNPLSEVTHKRRLSALGPGGLTRERAGFEVRDVHPTHYGRICPIETPEGPNIGLIASLATFARVNEYGFIETPYRIVKEGKVTPEVRYFSALEEENFVIAQANATLADDGTFLEEFVSARKHGEFVMMPASEIELMDVSPNQLVSVAASMIPFLEHDDANRALMGSNMQRQAVPLVRTHAPLVGTALEARVAQDSGACVIARRPGVVEDVDANRIVVRVDEEEKNAAVPDIYTLIKYKKSNQNTCINQRPIVKKGDRVRKGDVLADGPGTDRGELALGQNAVVAFMPWGGYNFEDAILVSERMTKEDVFTSIHIEEFECVARDTKLGKEEITRDIPNMSEDALKNLDESGIVRIGAEVKPGDILVGKVTPKGETQLSPEEKLLRAIFGEKAGDVKDTSKRVPTGIEGTTIDVKIFSRKGVEKDERTQALEDQEEARLNQNRQDEIRIIEDNAFKRIHKLLLGKKVASKLQDDKGNVVIHAGTVLTDKIMDKLPRRYLSELTLEKGDKVEARIHESLNNLEDQVAAVNAVFDERIKKLKRGDELPPGVIKIVKVYVAIKRKLSVGDKMAGRHGNKGVISRVLPVEDMPYLPDGTPVDIVLNPLGVPSRMNVGQILETHMGWACKQVGQSLARLLDDKKGALERARKTIKKIYADPAIHSFVDKLDLEDMQCLLQDMEQGIYITTPVFDGARESDIQDLFDSMGAPEAWQTTLYDGKTGEAFDHKVTVGVMYMLKLHHLVEEKIHARSIGPYSLITQQPLGGKAQFGGQRLGEMEVWAMEAYGAAYSLQEFLTVKSDDVLGRNRMYEAIVKGENVLESGLPESFNVLVKELMSLAIDVDLVENQAGVAVGPQGNQVR